MTRAHVVSLATTIAVALFVGACGASDSVGSLEGDQGAGSGLDRRAVCERFDTIVGDSSLGDADVHERLDDLADDAIDDDLAEQVRSAADAIGDDGARGLDAPRRCARPS